MDLMPFRDHTNLEGTHAFLSASQHSWLNYDEERLRQVYSNSQEAARGTALHAFAHQANVLGLRMPRNHITINEFINDGLGYHMASEVVLYYSKNCYGTADLISFDRDKGMLRIFDLKNGRIPVRRFDQLHIYAALFCLEYRVIPEDIEGDFRLYQNDEVRHDEDLDMSEISDIMRRIIRFDELINEFNAGL